jgi:hypothetical protein
VGGILSLMLDKAPLGSGARGFSRFMPTTAEIFIAIVAVATPVHIIVQELPLVSEALFFPVAELFRHVVYLP